MDAEEEVLETVSEIVGHQAQGVPHVQLDQLGEGGEHIPLLSHQSSGGLVVDPATALATVGLPQRLCHLKAKAKAKAKRLTWRPLWWRWRVILSLAPSYSTDRPENVTEYIPAR